MALLVLGQPLRQAGRHQDELDEHQALRALANRLVGILHGCLRHHHTYDEPTAWPATQPQLAHAA